MSSVAQPIDESRRFFKAINKDRWKRRDILEPAKDLNYSTFYPFCPNDVLPERLCDDSNVRLRSIGASAIHSPNSVFAGTRHSAGLVFPAPRRPRPSAAAISVFRCVSRCSCDPTFASDAAQQFVVQVGRGTKPSDAPGRQGETTENTVRI